MLHIFFIHSGITIIAAYDYIKQKLEQGNDVVVITSRGVRWTFFTDSLQVINLDEMLKGKGENLNLRKSTFKKIWTQIKDWKQYLKNLRKIINNQIVKGRDYLIYLPIYLDDFVRHPNCKGYFFLEEGVFAYYDRNYVSKIARNTFQTRLKKIVFPLFGERYYPIDYEGKSFMGSVAISGMAFPWHEKEHIVRSVESYINEVGDKVQPYDNIIVTEVLTQDNATIEKCLAEIISFICSKHSRAIGIKMHPKMYTKYIDKALEVERLIKRLDLENKITILPCDYIVENNIFKYHTTIFSLFELSSLSLYAIYFNASTYFVQNKNDAFIINKIETVNDFLSIICS